MIWSAVLAAVGMLSLALIGCKWKSGWAIHALAQILWIIYAFDTAQYPFIVSSAAYLPIGVYTWIRWRALERRPPAHFCYCQISDTTREGDGEMPAETIHGDGTFDVRISWGAGAEQIQVASLNDVKPLEGFHTTISDRGKVNRMIAVLRRARDHAFGKDE